MSESKFVGRQAELDRLQQFLTKAAAAASQVVFVAGEAGSGKSALANEFLRRAEAADDKLIAAVGECNAQTAQLVRQTPVRLSIPSSVLLSPV